MGNQRKRGIRQKTKTPRSDQWRFSRRRMIKGSCRKGSLRCGPQRPFSNTKGRSRRKYIQAVRCARDLRSRRPRFGISSLLFPSCRRGPLRPASARLLFRPRSLDHTPKGKSPLIRPWCLGVLSGSDSSLRTKRRRRGRRSRCHLRRRSPAHLRWARAGAVRQYRRVAATR